MDPWKRGPTASKRYCRACEKVTTWQYDKHVFHSRCTICHGTFSIRPENVEKVLAEERERYKNGR